MQGKACHALGVRIGCPTQPHTGHRVGMHVYQAFAHAGACTVDYSIRVAGRTGNVYWMGSAFVVEGHTTGTEQFLLLARVARFGAPKQCVHPSAACHSCTGRSSAHGPYCGATLTALVAAIQPESPSCLCGLLSEFVHA